MSNAVYFVFGQRDKGGCFIEPLTAEQLENALGPDGDYHGRPILSAMPDWEYTEEGIVIIKGEIVVPTPIQTVTKYQIP